MLDGMGQGESVNLGGSLVAGNDVYIGARSTIMPVTISEGCVIGAGSFVNKDCEPWGICVGSPARRIGERPRLLFFYELLKQRKHKISHKTLPPFEEYMDFVIAHSYRVGFLIKTINGYIESIAPTKIMKLYVGKFW